MKTLQHQLTHLEQSGLIGIATLLPELEYLFRHALVQDAAYESLLRQDRRELHRAVGEAIEAAYPHRLDDLAPTLAMHFLGAGAADRALHYYTRAGDRALASYANAEAEAHYRAALDFAPDDPSRLSKLGDALFAQSRLDECMDIWQAAINAYQPLQAYDEMARLYAKLARAAAYAGYIPRRIEFCEAGMSAVPEQATAGYALLLQQYGTTLSTNAQYSQAHRVLQRAVEIAREAGDDQVLCETLISLAFTADRDEALNLLHQAIEIANRARLLQPAQRAYNNLGVIFEQTGQFRQSLSALLRSLAIAERIGNAGATFVALFNVITCSAPLGEIESMERLKAAALAIRPSLGNNPRADMMLVFIEARLNSVLGNFTAELAALQRLREAYGQMGDTNAVQRAQTLIATSYADLRRWQEAAEAFREAMTLPVTSEKFFTWTYLEQIRVHAHFGDLEQARFCLQEAYRVAGDSPNFEDRMYLDHGAARLAAAEQHWDKAFATYDELTARLADHECRFDRARIMIEWAETHHQRGADGDRSRAIDLLRAAHREFEAMHATGYAARIAQHLTALTEESPHEAA